MNELKETLIDPILLLDHVLRNEHLVLNDDIYLASDRPGKLQLYVLFKDVPKGYEVGLCSEDEGIADFIERFDLATFDDLDKINLTALWEMYSKDEAYLECVNLKQKQTYHLRIKDGISTVEGAVAYLKEKATDLPFSSS